MSEMTEREYEQMLDTFRTASEWHGGQWSALYSYASTGEIHGEEHKAELLLEIDECELLADSPDSDLSEVERAALDHLRYTVECWPNEAI